MRRIHLWTFAILAVLALLYFIWPGYSGFIDVTYWAFTSGDIHQMNAWARWLGVWGLVGFIGLVVGQVVVVVIPSIVLIILPVLMYGPVLGGAVAMLGLLLSASVGYWLGHRLGPVEIEELMGERTKERVSGFMERYGFKAVVAARLSPLFSTDAISILGGFLKMDYWKFITASALGVAPSVIIVAFLGVNLDLLKSVFLWVAVLSAAGIIAYAAYETGLYSRIMNK